MVLPVTDGVLTAGCTQLAGVGSRAEAGARHSCGALPMRID